MILLRTVASSMCACVLALTPSLARAQINVQKCPSVITVCTVDRDGEQRSIIAVRGHLITDLDKISRERVFVFGETKVDDAIARTPSIKLAPAKKPADTGNEKLYYSELTLESGYVYCQLNKPKEEDPHAKDAIERIDSLLSKLADKGETTWLHRDTSGPMEGIPHRELAPEELNLRPAEPDAHSADGVRARARFYFPFVLIRSLSAGSEGTEVVFWASGGEVFVYFVCGEVDDTGNAKSPVELNNAGTVRFLPKPGYYAKYVSTGVGLVFWRMKQMPAPASRTNEEIELMNVVERAKADFIAARDCMDPPIPPAPCNHAHH